MTGLTTDETQIQQESVCTSLVTECDKDIRQETHSCEDTAIPEHNYTSNSVITAKLELR